MARDKQKPAAFGVADGFDFSSDVTEAEEIEVKASPPAKKKKEPTIKPVSDDVKTEDDIGQNPYYDYHPKKGARGGSLGAPRKETRRVQISIGCTVEDKQLYQSAAEKDGRKLPDFVNTAIKEYIENHNLQ